MLIVIQILRVLFFVQIRLGTDLVSTFNSC